MRKTGVNDVRSVAEMNRRTLMLSGAACFVGLAMRPDGALAQSSGGELQTIVVGRASGPTGFDPEFNNAPGSNTTFRNCNAFPMAYAPKATGDIFQDDFSNLRPKEAESVEVSPDWSKVTVTLKKGVLSSAGNELTADDAIYRFQRNWALRGSQWGFIKDAMLLTEDSVKKLDKYVYSIQMTGPNVLAESVQAHMEAGLFDSVETKKHATDADPWSTKWLSGNLVSFGAWKLVEYVPGDSWTLERNENYHDPSVFTGNVQRVVFKIIPSSPTRVELLRAGAIDTALDLQSSEILALEKDGSVRVDSLPGNYLQWLGFNLRGGSENPLTDINVRKAIGQALPFDQLIARPYLGLAQQLKSVVAPIYPGYDIASKSFQPKGDVEEAKRLMSQSGYPKGFTIPLHIDIGQSGQEESAILIKAALANIGISVDINKVQTGDFFNIAFDRTKGFPGLFIYKDYAGTPDVNFGTHLYLKGGHCCAPGGYENADVDKLYNEAQKTVGNYDRRAELQRQIENIAFNVDPMGVPMQQIGFYAASSKNVGGWWWHSLNEISWEKGWKKV